MQIALQIQIAEATFRGSTLDFNWRARSNGGQNQNPKKPLGLSTKPKNIPWPKINPPKMPRKMKFSKKSLVADLCGRDTRALTRIFRWFNLNTPKNPHLNQTTPKNTSQNFLTKKKPESKISNPQKPSIILVTWNPEYLNLPPPPRLHLLGRICQSHGAARERPGLRYFIWNEDVRALTDAAENHNTERSRIFFNNQKDSNVYFIFLEKVEG